MIRRREVGDDARIGQKDKITHSWARRRRQAWAPLRRRADSVYIFGPTCREAGTAAAIVSPVCNTAAMNEDLAEITTQIAADANAVLLLTQAGWHLGSALDGPDNITLLPLPAKCPELNPQ